MHRTRVWYRSSGGYWCYRIYLAPGASLGGYGYRSEEGARRGLAERLLVYADIPL